MSEELRQQPVTSCPSCGADVGNATVCPNCGTTLGASANPNELKPADQQLLERFEKEPNTPVRPLPYQVTIGILLGVILIAMVMWLVTQKEEKFAEGKTAEAHQHSEGDHGIASAQDSLQMLQMMAKLNSQIDSIQTYLNSHPTDDSARINLAIAFSTKGDYDKAKAIYEAHLAKHPNDADVRVDYASVIIETTNDPSAGMKELEKAIAIDPQNAKALFNAAILSLQLQEDHNTGFAKSRAYLERAKAASLKTNPTFAGQIDMLLAEMDRKTESIRRQQDSAAKM